MKATYAWKARYFYQKPKEGFLREFQPKFECTAPRGECIYHNSKNICIDPDYEYDVFVCPHLKVTRK
jgi:hypothetical protein